MNVKSALSTHSLLATALLLCVTAEGQSAIPPTAPTEAATPVLTSLFTPPAHGSNGSGSAMSQTATAYPATPSSRLQVQRSQVAETLHIMTGQSILLHGTVAMKRVYVGNPLLLSSFNSSPTDILLTGKEPGVTSLAVWDVNGQNQLYTVSVDLDPTEMQSAVNQMYPGADIRVTGVGDRLELNGSVPTQDALDGLGKLGSSYAKQVANSVRLQLVKPRQVELKLQIIEVDRSKLDQFAVNFNRASPTVPIKTGTGMFANPLNLSIGYLNQGLTFDIQALAQQSVLQILAEPTLTTLSGGTAKFLSGGEFPVPIAQTASAAGGAASNAITIQFRQYGVKVDFLPVVGDDGSIRLKIAPEVSTLDYANAVTIAGFTIPALSTRRADTEIMLKDGQSFVLSGLLDRRAIENLGKVPGISKVPILGELFRSKNNVHSITELVFVVTANIIDPLRATPPVVQPVNVSPFMTQEQFDDDVRRKQAGKTNR